VVISTTSTAVEKYELVLESFDCSASFPQETLKTDKVTIYVTEYVRNVPVVSFIVITKEAIGLLSVEHVYSKT